MRPWEVFGYMVGYTAGTVYVAIRDHWWRILLVVWALVLIVQFAQSADVPPQPGVFGQKPSSKAVELGRMLFHDPRLSADATVSCSSCHQAARGFSDGRAQAVGIRGQLGPLHSMTIINAGYSAHMFWDGRTIGQPTQSLLPLTNPVEMGNASEQDVITRLRLIPGYVRLFTDIFPIDPSTLSAVNGPNMAYAMAAFQTSITSFDAPIDRYLDGDKKALSPEAAIGERIFRQANCTSCHQPPLFTDNLFHNNGSEHATKMRVTEIGRFGVVPANLRTRDMVRAFKTATLREVDKSAPYMHTGFMPDLERVVQHYALGGMKYDGTVDPFIDPRIREIGKLNLTKTQQAYLVRFLREAFRGSNYPLIESPRLP